MKQWHSFILLLLASVILHSCQKNIDQFIPDPQQPVGPDTTWYNNIGNNLPIRQLRANLALPMLVDSFIATPGATTAVNLSSGLTINLGFGSLVNTNGSAASGSIVATSRLLTSKGDLIRMSQTTNNENNDVLETGGNWYLSFSKNDSALQVASNRTIRVNHAVTYHLPQPGFYTSPIGFNQPWTYIADSFNTVQFTGAQASQQYQFNTNNLGWLSSLQRFSGTSQTNGTIQATIPANFTNGNSIAYLSFNNMNAVSPLVASVANRKFTSYPVPSGEAGQLIVISYQDGAYYLGNQNFTVGTGAQNIIVTPVRTTLAAVLAYLASL